MDWRNCGSPEKEWLLGKIRHRPAPCFRQAGMTLIEILVSLFVFSFVMAGAFTAYQQHSRYTSRETRFAVADIELGIARSIIELDISLAGYGLAYDYGSALFDPRGVILHNDQDALALVGSPTNFNVTPDSTPDTNPDVLRLMGTALSLESRASRAWTYIDRDETVTPPILRPAVLGDAREDLRSDATGNDVVILLEPTTRTLLTQGGDWQFLYGGVASLLSIPSGTPSSPLAGTVAYALYTNGAGVANQPYYSVQYYLGDLADSPPVCAPGTATLLRAESRTEEAPTGGTPLLSCVLDFQVALGFDTDAEPDGAINLPLYNVGVAAVGFDRKELGRRLKLVNVYILVQAGLPEAGYQFPDATIFVGDPISGAGRQITLTAEQRRYRWRVISLAVAPANVR